MITSSAIEDLKSRFQGKLIVQADPQYESARRVFNAAIDRRPALIAQCANADDVTQAVNFAREQNA